MMAAVERRTAVGALVGFYLMTMGIPLFLHPNGAVYREESFRGAQVFPVSLFLAPLLVVAYVITRRRVVFKPGYVGPALIAFLLALAYYLLGEILRATAIAPQMWAIYAVPMFLGLLAGIISAEYYGPERLLKLFAWAVASVALLHVVYSLVTLGVQDTFFSFQRGAFGIGLFSFYQRLIYYPSVVALALAYFLFFGSKLRYPVIAILLVEQAILAAREPVAFILFVIAAFAVWARSIQAVSGLAIGAAVLGVTLLSFPNVLPYLRIFAKFQGLLAHEADALTGGRADIIASLSDEIGGKPVFGRMLTLAGHFGTPHNQYLEYVLRGGVLLLIGSLLLVLSALWCAYRLARHDRIYGYFLLVLLGMLAVSFNINTPMRAPYTSMIVWTFVGFLWAKYDQEVRRRARDGVSRGSVPIASPLEA